MNLKKMNNKLLIFLSYLLVTLNVNAESVISLQTKINEINSYSGIIDADTLIRVDDPHAACPGGYYLKITDIGFEKNISILLSAFHSQSNIVVRADGSESAAWPHSASRYCKITQIQLYR